MQIDMRTVFINGLYLSAVWRITAETRGTLLFLFAMIFSESLIYKLVKIFNRNYIWKTISPIIFSIQKMSLL